MSQNEETQAAVVPNLFVASVNVQRDFYLEKLGFEHAMGVVGKDGEFDFCIVQRSGVQVMISRPENDIHGSQPEYPTQRPVDFYINVEDVDAYHQVVSDNGAPIVEELTTQWWGDRTFVVQDPYGYRIWFFQTVSAPTPPQGVTIV